MNKSISASFKTRRDADMAIEHLVQEFGVERTDIFVSAEGAANSAGTAIAGSDTESPAPSSEAREDGAHEGAINVSVDVNDAAMMLRIANVFEDFDGTVDGQG